METTSSLTQTIIAEEPLISSEPVSVSVEASSGQTIYYCFKKSTGEFMGSGTPFFDDQEIGSTTVPCDSYDSSKEIPYWMDGQWINKSK